MAIDFGRLQKLKHVDLGGNNFGSGEADEMSFLNSMTNCTNLQVLDLYGNKLFGIIPSFIGKTSSLYFLSLRSNQLHGDLPKELGLLSKLQYLTLSNNSLSGPLPHTLIKCRLLEIFDIGYNLVNDSFPPWTDTLPELRVLVLRSNIFHGSVGTSKTKYPFPKLKIFDISNNNLNGLLPLLYFHHFEAMVNVSGEDTKITDLQGQYYGKYYDVHMTLVLKGNEYHGIPVLRVFVQIDLSNNNFEGEIPDSVGRFKFLKSLNISHNNLKGHIPSCFGNLTSLEALDLSSNKLVGEIPSQLIDITTLEVLDLSYNQLVGRIPQGAQFNTFGNDSYIRNVALCGPPLTKMCEDDGEVQDPALPEEDEDIQIFSLIGMVL